MNKITAKSLTIKYAGVQGIYWMVFCTINSFAAVSLLARNFNNQQIGWLLALSGVISAVLQPTIGSFADRAAKVTLKMIISVISFVNIVLLVGLVVTDDNLVITSILYGGIVTLTFTLQPLVNSLIFEYINNGMKISFGMTRGIGSISFAVLSFILGQLINQHSPSFLPFVSIGLYSGLLLLMQTFPIIDEHKTSHQSADKKVVTESFWVFVKKYDRFLPFLLALVFVFIFHTVINTYLVQIMVHLGGNEGDLGLSLTIAAAVELPVMLAFGYLVSKVSNGTLLKVAGCFYIVRSVLFIMATTVAMVNFAQLFQALSFAIFTPASVYYVNQLMRAEDKIKGQTFIVGATTLGSVFGNLVGGWLLEQFTVDDMLLVGLAAAVIGCLLLFYSIRTKEQRRVEEASSAS